MPDQRQHNVHDEQTTEAARQIREAVKGLRGSMTQRDTDAFVEKMIAIAKGLEEQGKSPEEAERFRLQQERGEAWKRSIDAPRAGKPASIPPATIHPAGFGEVKPQTDRRQGIPVVPAQPTTGKRDEVEKTAKKADEDIKKTSEKK